MIEENDEKVEIPEEKIPDKTKTVNLSNSKDLLNLIFETKNLEDIKPLFIAHIKKIINDSKLHEKYKIIFLYDPVGRIGEYTAENIYQAISKGSKKDILMILVSKGGSIESAYQISKVCKHYGSKFIVTIPRKAKSAATLLTLGADEIHMGIMSELGPIDPQIGGLPALGLSNAVEYLASLCDKHPKSVQMLATYLSKVLDLQTLGYFQRVSESEAHYAKKLLEGKNLPEGMTAESVANSLVNDYKDHSFVIDKDEIKNYLGEYIKTDTPEFKLSDEIHKFLALLSLYVKVIKNKTLSIEGNIEDNMLFAVPAKD